jgi:SRSO17 transposase
MTMRVPLECIDQHLSAYLELFRDCFSKPQYRYFVIILLGIILFQGNGTVSNIIDQVGTQVTLQGASHFLGLSPWSSSQVSQVWQEQFRAELAPIVELAHRRQRARQRKQKRKGRRQKTVVTGYLIGDDSVMEKLRGKKMEGLGRHYSSSAEHVVTGHSLVLGLYLLSGRHCPLEPQMYRQRTVCEAEGIPFLSKVDLMVQTIENFIPVKNTQTHVLLDSWYGCKRIWKVCRQLDYLITTGLRGNRRLRIDDPESDQGWSWLRLDDYDAERTADDFIPLTYPSMSGNETVYVHVVSTRVKKLYRCQLILIRRSLDGEARFWASSDLNASPQALLQHISARWTIETLFEDAKSRLGLAQYQLISSQAIMRFWTLVLTAYTFLEQHRNRLALESQRYTTIGQAKRHLQRTHYSRTLQWLTDIILKHGHLPDNVRDLLVT